MVDKKKSSAQLIDQSVIDQLVRMNQTNPLQLTDSDLIFKDFPIKELVAHFDNRPAIFAVHPTVHERHGHEKLFTVKVLLILSYQNNKQLISVNKYS